MSKKVKIFVAASVLLNLLLVGLVVGRLWRRSCETPPARESEEVLAAKFPDAQRQALLDAIAKMRSDSQDLRQQIAESRQRVLSILTAPEFDARAFQTEVDRLHDLRNRLMQRRAEMVKGLAGQMNQDERKLLGDFLRHPPSPPTASKPQ